MTVRLRAPILLSAFLGTVLVAVVAHVWMTDPLGVMRFVYPVEAVIAKTSARCSPDSPDWVRGAIRRAIDDNYSPSSQLAYVGPDGQLHHCESGWLREMFASPRLSHDHRFRYASTTKLFTADAILRLIEAGRLSLNDRLVDLLPELLPATDERLASVTIEHLLTHQAGFDRMRSPDPMFLNGKRPWCPYDVGQLAHLRLDFTPGERQVYSNLGYCLLGVVLERVTGVSYRDWVTREYALNDAGMRFVDGDFFPDEVRYDFRNSNVYGEWYSKYFDFHAISSSAGLSGSASAMAKAIHSMTKQNPFGLTSAALPDGCNQAALRSCYGYAFFVLSKPDEEFHIYVQPGFLYGVSALVVVDSEGGVVVWLGNGMPGAGGEVGNDMTIYLLDVLRSYYSRRVPADEAPDAL